MAWSELRVSLSMTGRDQKCYKHKRSLNSVLNIECVREMKLGRTAHTMIVVGIIGIASFSTLVMVPERASAYIPHAPIYISGNANFTAANGVTGGGGSALDPYIIEGWEINASAGTGIEILNTDAHFMIRNVYVHSGGWDHHGINFENVANAHVENTTLSKNRCGIILRLSPDATITDSNVTWNEGYAITLWDSYNATITGNNISSNEGMGISLHYSPNAIITGNTISNDMGGIRLDDSNNATITGNNISYMHTDYGIHLVYSDYATISSNNVYQNSNIGIALDRSDNTIIADNTVLENSVGISVRDSINATITGNILTQDGVVLGGYILSSFNTHTITTDNIVNGLPLYYHKDCNGLDVDGIPAGQLIIVNCTGARVSNLQFNDTDVGVIMAFVTDSVLTSNTFVSNFGGIYFFLNRNISVSGNVLSDSLFGIYITYSKDITFAKNTVSSNYYHGIYLIESANTTITGNEVSDNGYGMYLQMPNGATIKNNTISDNLNGLYYRDSANLLVYHNNFIKNLFQVYPGFGIGDSWDDGYPSGGNYWSDYTGADQYGGPNQDQPGEDGIGDTPYVVSMNDQDRYPLMSPFGVFPRLPEILQAILSGSDVENVTLTWNLSFDDGMGLKSVVGYEVYRNMTYDPDGLGYGLVASLPNGTSSFVDNLAGEGDPNDYFYRVCAVDVNNNRSCALNQAGKFTRSMSPGPNLVSIPLIQYDERIAAVLQTLSFDKLWFYNSFEQEWKTLIKSKPYLGDLTHLNHTMGFWVNVTEESNLTVAGLVPSQIWIPLRVGWNLVGFPSFLENYTIEDMIVLTGAIERVEGFDASASPYFLKLLQDSDVLQVGQGYWVRVAWDTFWIIIKI
jgi:parallel beta-helix repeat protein